MMEIDKEKVDEARNSYRCADSVRKAEEKIAKLELEIEKRKKDNEVLEAKVRELEDEKTAAGGEVLSLIRRNSEMQRQLDHLGHKSKADAAVDLDEDELFSLVLENRTLELEKKKAESDAGIWKGMVELLIAKLDDFAGPRNLDQWLNEFVKGSDDADYLSVILGKLKRGARVVNAVDADTNCNTPGRPRGLSLESKKSDWQTRKHLSFDEGKVQSRVVAPSTPAVAKTSFNVINICDSDDEDETSDQLISKNRVSSASVEKYDSGKTTKESLSEQDHVEETDDGEDKFICTATPKRKRAVNVVNSDTDTDDEDNVPLSKLRRMNIQESCSTLKRSVDIQGVMTRSKRRLFAEREREEKLGAKRSSSNQTSGNKNQRRSSTDDVEDTESEEEESVSEEQSVSSFIDDRSDPGSNDSDDNADNVNEADSNAEVDSEDNAPSEDEKEAGSDVEFDSGAENSDDSASTESEDEMDLNVELSKIVSKLRRSKGEKQKWIYQTDMLRAFAEDPELCMKAVCALYRQQTEGEKAVKETLVSNNRGFSKFHANRGSKLAEFLTDGDPHCDVKKSVQQLQERYPNGIKQCRRFAKHYSKQLFEIYTHEEDPFFNQEKLGHK